MQNLSRLNCAGQGCEARSGCRRYQIRLPRKAIAGEVKVFDWASFDVEQKRLGECKALIVFREA